MYFWEGWKQEANWNHGWWGADAELGMMFAYLDREQAFVPPTAGAQGFVGNHGNQGSLWDSVGLGYFSQFKLFLYGYPQYSFLFWDIFYLKKQQQNKTNPEHLDFEKAHSPK